MTVDAPAVPPPERALAGKVALVTGASADGIGGATARRLARSGAALFLASAEPQADRDRIVDECIQLGAEATRTQCRVYDFSEEASAVQMVADAIAAVGRVDILVNNAAVRIRKVFGTFAAADLDMMLAVNVKAPFLASQAVLPQMRRQGGGRIIHVASQLGVVTANDQSVYSMTKAALISLTRSMALELAQDGIIVNAVSPGPIMSGYMAARMEGHDAARAALVGRVPLGRFGTPDEVAEAIHFLATCEGGFIDGHNLIVDGGYVAQ